MIDIANRRTALAAALCALDGGPFAGIQWDAVRLDGYVSLFAAADAAGVDATPLALAAAEGDDATSMLARTLLTARSLLAAAEPGTRDLAAKDADAIALLRLIEAAIADSDEALIRFLTSELIGLDIAHVRAARNSRRGAPLRSTLGQALDNFSGAAPREVAARAASALRAVSEAAADESATLESLVRAAVGAFAAARLFAPLSKDAAHAIHAGAASSDAIWLEAKLRVPLIERARVFLEATLRTAATNAAWPLADPSFLEPASRLATTNTANESRDGMPVDSDAPWEWPTPEQARPVTAPAMTFSASRLNAYVKCGRRWFFEYLCDAVEDQGSIQATYGRVLHEALEALHHRETDFTAGRSAAVLGVLMQEIDAAFGRSRRAFESPWEYEVSRNQARRIAPRYVEWLIEQSAISATAIVALEAVHRLRTGGHDFIGYIDRIDAPIGGGPVTIYDYKTGRMADDPRAYLEAVRSGEEAQLPLYYFMCRAAGSEVGRMALVSVRDPQAGIRVLALDIVDGPERIGRSRAGSATCTKADLDAALAALLQRCDLLTQTGVHHFDPGVDPPCGYCAYFAACRERPHATESIFAR